jgi:uncharacterized protein (TIGR02996 family)
MSEEAAFLAAIRARPGDETLRLVYADWLDEHGRPESSFLRLDCQLSALDSTDPRRGELRSAFWEARANLDPKWLAAVSRMFSDVSFVSFDKWAGSDTFFRCIFDEWLQRADEPSLWGTAFGEQYRYTATGGPQFSLRIDADVGEAVVKVARGGEPHVSRYPFPARELDRFRRMVERTRFWEIPSPNDRCGMDGAFYLFEARVGDRYHFVHRWSPDRDDFAKLCRYCDSLLRRNFEPRRWWQWW